MLKLGRDEIRSLLQTAVGLFPHEECNTCECFLGYIAQISIDSNYADRDHFIQYKVDRKVMHKCLGCDPCPPGELYADYMKRTQISEN